MSSQRSRTSNGSRRQYVTEDQCFLKDPTLGIITEMDHILGQCLCHLCTCGRCKCPGKKQTLYPKSMYNTRNRNEFKPKRREGDVNRNYEPYQPNNGPMDLQTTNQNVYKAFTVERKPVVEDVPYQSNIKFMAETSYGQDFPSYGAVGQLIQKSPQHPYRGRMASLDARTTYGTSFYGEKSDKRSSAIDLWASNGVINPKTEKEFQSTATAFHTHQWDPKEINNRVYREREIYTPAHYSTAHFKTEARDNYQQRPNSVKGNPRLMRKLMTGVKGNKNAPVSIGV